MHKHSETQDTGSQKKIFHEPQFQWSYLKLKHLPVWLLLAIIFFCTWMPRRFALAVGSGLGLLFYKLNKKRRHISATNIAMCFPEKDEAERHKLMVDAYKSYGQNIIDLGFVWWSPLWRIKKNTIYTGYEHFEKALADDKPILLLTPHAAGMDQCGIMLSMYHHTAISMMKSLNNEVLDWIVTRGRMRYCGKGGLLLRQVGLRHMVRLMKAKKAMCYYIPDEDLGPENSIFVPFFGVQSATIPMLGRMAKLSGATVLPTMTEICQNGKHHIHILPAFENFPTDDDYGDTLKMNQALEKLVLISPRQYMWTLKMFKTRPEGEPNPYDY